MMKSLQAYFKTSLARAMSKAGQQVNQPLYDTEMRALRSEIGATMPDNPVLQGARVYAQCDEDGIMLEILRRVGAGVAMSKTVVEIGASDGLENMTHALVLAGYRGYWIEGSKEKVEFVRQQLGGDTFKSLKVLQSFVTLGNIDELVSGIVDFTGTKDVDLLSMDIDGNDIYILAEMLKALKPKVIAAEYNGKFPPPISLTIAYDDTHNWQGDDYYGVSLQRLVDTLTDYALVSCNLSGVNSFFVRRDLLKGFTAYPIEQLYQPPRHYLTDIKRGQRASLKYLRNLVQAGGR